MNEGAALSWRGNFVATGLRACGVCPDCPTDRQGRLPLPGVPS